MREGYQENAPGEGGWQDAPNPLSSIIQDPLLAPDNPSVEWAIGAIRSYLDGTRSLDQLYRSADDLGPFRTHCDETLDEAEHAQHLMATFCDDLWLNTLNAVLLDDETDAREYLTGWLEVLQRGPDAFRAAVASGESPFTEVD